jgi:hypothetical protein
MGVRIDKFSLKEFSRQNKSGGLCIFDNKECIFFFYSTDSTLMRLAVPRMLIGTPAMITIRSPGLAMPNSFGILFDFSGKTRKFYQKKDRMSLNSVIP